VEVDGTAFTIRRPGMVVRANLGGREAGGLPAWGIAMEEAAGDPTGAAPP
jgi:maltooligosyltrehalose trehalohydrolase